jgi:hypothetical protein
MRGKFTRRFENIFNGAGVNGGIDRHIQFEDA